MGMIDIGSDLLVATQMQSATNFSLAPVLHKRESRKYCPPIDSWRALPESEQETVSTHADPDWVEYVPPDETRERFSILLLGNEQSAQSIRITLLAQLDFGVAFVEAKSGKSGLQAIAHEAVDLIIYGEGVSDMDGLIFLDQLNETTSGRMTPVIEILNADTTKDGIKALKMGAHDCVLKEPDGSHLEILPILVSRVQAEKRVVTVLQKSAGLHEIITDKLPSVIYQVSLQDGRNNLCISRPVLDLGITPERWGSDTELHHRLCHEGDRERVKNALVHSFKTGAMFECEYRINTLGNAIRWFHDKASVIMDKCGRPLMMQGVMTDITNSKALESELLQYRNMLEKMVTQRTDQLIKRIAILESCNSNLSTSINALHQRYLDLKASVKPEDGWQAGNA